jgi:hypothetical protein
MWKQVRIAVPAITVIVTWFTVVTLGFGSHLWPLLAIVP